MRILIVEDDHANQLFLKKVLEQSGDCVAVSDGAAGVQAYADAAAKGEPFGVVIMDIMLPEMSGLTAIDRIREYEALHPRTIPRPAHVVVVTATSDSQDIIHAYCSGNVFAYMKKPLLREDLLATMDKIVEDFRAAM
jgi:two-component system chemotaxis response regulator CheY